MSKDNLSYDDLTPGFFWFVGQGGYGIQSSPALSRTAAALAQGQSVPDDVLAAGLNTADIHTHPLEFPKCDSIRIFVEIKRDFH